MRLSRVRFLQSKKRVVIVGISILFLLVSVGYVAWSKQIWSQYTPAHTQWQQAIKSDVEKVVTLPTASPKEQDVVKSKLEVLSLRISTEQSSTCNTNPLVGWQRKFIAAHNDAYMACEQNVADVASFQKQLDVVIRYISDEQALAEILATAPSSDKLSDDTWGQQIATWGEVGSAVEEMSVSDDFKPARQQAVEKIAAVKIAWEQVIAAHQAKDKVQFMAAQDALGAGYDGLNDVVIVSEKTLASLIKILNDRYLRSFSE